MFPLVTAAIAAASLVAPGPAQTVHQTGASAGAAAASRSASRTMQRLVNAEREARGLPSLRWSARLARAARGHSADMVRRQYFDHTTQGGGSFDTRISATGYGRGTSWSSGETLAWGGTGRNSPRSILDGWLNSPPHREILLDPGYREIGVGTAAGTPVGIGGTTFTADLGVRR